MVEREHERLDAVVRPVLLHGDLWTANILLDPAAAEPRVIDVLDSERAWWGDALADWAQYRVATRQVVAERHAFWAAYGGPPSGAKEQWRVTVYRGGWHAAAERVEAARHGHEEIVARTVQELHAVLSNLHGGAGRD